MFDGGQFDDGGGGPEGGPEGGGGLEGGGPEPIFWSSYSNFSIILVFLGTYNTVFFLYRGIT